MGYLNQPVQDLASDARDYVDLQIDKLKLQAVKGLSLSLGEILALLLVIFSCSIVLLGLAAGCILLLGKWIGSYAGASFIIAGVFAIVSVVLFLLRKKLFINTFVQLFADVFFDDDNEKEDEA